MNSNISFFGDGARPSPEGWKGLLGPPRPAGTKQDYQLTLFHYKLNSRLDLRKNFFSVRTPPTWNALPLLLRQSSSVNQFKIGYDKHKN